MKIRIGYYTDSEAAEAEKLTALIRRIVPMRRHKNDCKPPFTYINLTSKNSEKPHNVKDST